MILDHEGDRDVLLQGLNSLGFRGEEGASTVLRLAAAIRGAVVATAPSSGDALMPRRAGAPHGDGQLQEQVAPSVGNGQRQVS